MTGPTCDGLGWCVKRDAAPLGEPWCNGAGRCVKGYATPVIGPAVPSDEDELIAALAEAVPLSSSASDRAIADALLPVVRRYADQRAAEELATLAFRLVSQGVQDEAVFEEIGALRDALTREATT